MSDLFQREQNDEISVRNIDVPNPLPALLDERYEPSIKVLSAKASVVLKILFSDSNSLNAFSKDVLCSYYLVYHRDEQQPFFLRHIEEGAKEALCTVSMNEMDEEARQYIPANFR